MGEMSFLAFGSNQEFQSCKLHGGQSWWFQWDYSQERGQCQPSPLRASGNSESPVCCRPVGKGTALRPLDKVMVTYCEIVRNPLKYRTSQFSLIITIRPELEFYCMKEFKKMQFETFSAIK